MNLAVFLPNWVGDVVMTTPALRALREHFTKAKLIGVCRPYVAETLAGLSWFDELLLDQGKGWSRGVLPLAQQLRQRKIETAVLFTNSFRTALAAWLGKCQRRLGYGRDGRSWLLTEAIEPIRGTHEKFKPTPIIDAYNLLAVRAGTGLPGYRMELATTAADEAAAEVVWQNFDKSIHRPVILFNPGAAFGAAKHWPLHHFARLARLLVDSIDAQILVLCGPKERDLAQLIVQQADRCAVHSLAQAPLSLGLTKACVKRADLLITTDSGPRHFAAAFGKPVVSLFGPTHIEWTDTHYAREIHLQHRLPCGPCQQRVCNLKGDEHHQCMELLKPEEVFQATARLLDGSLPLRLVPDRRRAG
jgi:heptosyltransferase-2